jgi:hypothetical protein
MQHVRRGFDLTSDLRVIVKLAHPVIEIPVHKLFTMMESASRMRFFGHAENSLSVQ